jgi:hypothetical protein
MLVGDGTLLVSIDGIAGIEALVGIPGPMIHFALQAGVLESILLQVMAGIPGTEDGVGTPGIEDGAGIPGIEDGAGIPGTTAGIEGMEFLQVEEISIDITAVLIPTEYTMDLETELGR